MEQKGFVLLNAHLVRMVPGGLNIGGGNKERLDIPEVFNAKQSFRIFTRSQANQGIEMLKAFVDYKYMPAERAKLWANKLRRGD